MGWELDLAVDGFVRQEKSRPSGSQAHHEIVRFAISAEARPESPNDSV